MPLEKMKSLVFSSLILSAVLVYANAKVPDLPWKFGTCLRPDLGEQLDDKKFFNGTWYSVKSVGNILFDASGICLTTEFKLKENGKIDILHSFYTTLGQYLHLRGTSKAKYAKFMGAFFPVTYDTLGGVYQVEIPFSVVDTDYDNWALVYYCKQYLGFKIEMGWMMSRKTSTDHLEELESASMKLGLDPGKFVEQKNDNCPPGRPHL